MGRLGILAIVSQWFFAAFLQVGILQNLNIFFTLFLGVFVIYCFNIAKTKTLPYLLLFMVMFVAVFIYAGEMRVDYGGVGVMFIVLLYLARTSRLKTIFVPFVVTTVLITLYFPVNAFFAPLFVGGLFSIFPIMLYNGRLGPRGSKFIFYSFYPAHLFIIIIFRDFIFLF